MAEEKDRLDELFEELDTLADAKLKRKLNKIKKIEPSEGFRDVLWAKIERAKKREDFLDGLFPRMSWPAWTFASLAVLAAWFGGMHEGKNLYNKDEVELKRATELGLSEFGSDYPSNSIQSWVVKTTLEPTEE